LELEPLEAEALAVENVAADTGVFIQAGDIVRGGQ